MLYTIEPIAGREAIQRNFAKLPEKANSYNGRKLTLNERFAVIERGYNLVYQGDLPPVDVKAVRLVPVQGFEIWNREETISELEKLSEKNREKVNRSQVSTPAKNPPHSCVSASP